MSAASAASKQSDWANNEEIKIFQEYLRIPSVHPNVDYEPCIQFLQRQAADLQLPITIHYPANGDRSKPLAIITWTGSAPELPSILLNSHMDVVPVFPENWTHPPFSAHLDAEGRIFARGAQDMKSVGVQYLAAIRQLRKSGVQQLKRTVHVCFVPDEETGGVLGMRVFIPTAEFRALNVGFALDEGIASETDVLPVFYAERTAWKVRFNCSGTAGHGSLLLKNTAGEKILHIQKRMSEFRGTESQRLDAAVADGTLTIGDVTTVNLTMLEGGIQSNVVPPSMSLTYDVRLAVNVSLADFEAKLRLWCREAAGAGNVDDVEIEFPMKEPYVQPTDTTAANPFWSAFHAVVVGELGMKIKETVFPGATDSRFIRAVGVPAIGFSPMDRTPVLLHDHDEFLRADTYLRGIEIYAKLVERFANV